MHLCNFLVLWMGCGTLTVEEPALSGEEPARVEELLPGAVVSHVLTAADLTLVAVTTEGVRELGPGGTVADVEGGPDVALGSVDLDGQWLLSAPDGLFGRGLFRWELSPLSEAADSLGAGTLAGGDGELWIAGSQGLGRWRDGALQEVRLAGEPLPGGLSQWGPLREGEPSAWLLADGRLLSIRALHALREDPPAASNDPAPGEPSDLRADGLSRLWLIRDDLLLGRDSAGTWTGLRMPEAPTRILASSAAPDLWVLGPSGWVHERRDRWTPVTGVPEGEPMAVDAAGRLLVAGPSSLFRVALGRPLLWDGLRDGEHLGSPVTVRLLPSEPDQVASLTASLDGVPIEIRLGAFPIDPMALSPGAHEIAASVTYQDGEEVLATRSFAVGTFEPATWSDDVAPISERHCSRCHGPGGTAHPLDTAQSWETEIETLVYNISTGNMPLPPADPLTQGELALVRSWRAGGFLP